eukprot:358332-Chlamydomonas_euryale.AAC.4
MIILVGVVTSAGMTASACDVGSVWVAVGGWGLCGVSVGGCGWLVSLRGLCGSLRVAGTSVGGCGWLVCLRGPCGSQWLAVDGWCLCGVSVDLPWVAVDLPWVAVDLPWVAVDLACTPSAATFAGVVVAVVTLVDCAHCGN